MWVRFTDKFSWSPPELRNTWTRVYKGGVHNVTRDCAAAAIAAGKAVRTVSPRMKSKSRDDAE